MTAVDTRATGPAELDMHGLHRAGILRALDVELAQALGRIGEESGPRVLLAAAIASRVVADGDVCADLARIVAEAPEALDRGPERRAGNTHAPVQPALSGTWPPLEAWLEELRCSPLTDDVDLALESDIAAHPAQPTDGHPLVLVGRRLYLRRYYEHELVLGRRLLARFGAAPDAIDGPLLRRGLDALFGAPAADGSMDLQRLGALMAVRRRFSILSGGPGTGKTRTVARILYLLLEQARAAGREPPRILLTAPTGKAAARLDESIRQERQGLEKLGMDAQLLAQIPTGARTLHRALGVLGGNVLKLRHHAQYPLSTEVVVVDEASMVDLPLMRRLLDAVPPDARLILLGDKDQLSSVEAGAVLGQLADAAQATGVSADLRDAVRSLTGDELPDALVSGREGATHAPSTAPSVGDCLVHFEKTYRYGDESGIAALAKAIRANDADAAQRLLEDGQHPDIHWHEATKEELPKHFDALVAGEGGFGAYLEPGLSDAARLEAFGKLRVLAPLREGTRGVAGLNQRIERALERAGLLESTLGPYAHRPVLVTANDYDVRLFNGDVAILVPGEHEGLRACFPAEKEGELRHLSPARLPPHQTCFAMTVHKSQGSEFDHVILVLPEEPNPVLTRELLYTAVSRAKKRVDIFGTAHILRGGIEASVQRAGRLGKLVGG